MRLFVAVRISLFAAAGAGVSNAQAPGASVQGAPSLFTAEQAAQGEASYDHNCLACHGEHLDDGDFGGPPLRGSYFQMHWGGGDVAALFSFTKTAMPPDNPGSLTDEDYADILAYILQYNGYKPGASELPTDPEAQSRLKLGAGGG
jgi:mono/diheme cytochrome c family protein